MKIGILQAGHSDERLVNKYGDFDHMFKHLLSDRGFEFETYNVVDSSFPKSPEAADGWLVTGSKHSAYEKLEWISVLENFLRESYKKNIPIVGICFGHQVLAQALGGVVEHFSGGWSIGPTVYGMDNEKRPLNIAAYHQDQVTKLPENSTCLGSSENCKNAFIAYGDSAYSIQAHPEFSRDFIEDLISLRESSLPVDLVASARNVLGSDFDTAFFSDNITNFFTSRKILDSAIKG